jgi:4-amino-4-deoxy-L-arabinose transferase-like glycosyltransferase
MTNDKLRMSNFELRNSTFVILACLLVAYLVIGALYAVRTPAWQVPDEPAHYNYVRYIAEGRGLPVLQPGDYDRVYLEQIKSARFPSSMPVDSIRYEAWQPPLYYLLAAPVYLLSGGSLLVLRLFSVVLGGGVVILAFLIVRRLAPGSPALALGTAAFVAFVPQHVAMLAGAQNDSLAELLLAAIVFQLSNLKCQTPALPTGGLWLRAGASISNGRWGMLGVSLGLALVTKGTIYMAAPLAALAIWLAYRALPAPRDWKWIAAGGTLVFIPALVIALPVWVRNIILYGWPDFLASIRHDAVVVGQPTPAEWIAKFGFIEYLRQFVVTSFHSFWGQFGWMGVPMNGRYYFVLALVSFLALVGLLVNLWSRISPPRKNRGPALKSKFEIWILIFWLLLAVAMYIGYNLKYVQFQGRYLFPALIPIGLAFTLGLRQWLTWLPRRWSDVVLGLAFAGLAALDLIALFRMIVPMLSP